MSAALGLACAKGTEISQTEVVYLQLQPASQPDAGVDAGALPEEPTGEAQADPIEQ